MDSKFRKIDEFSLFLKVLENSDSKGQEHLLRSIQTEKPQMANLLHERLLTVNKILAFDVKYLIDIVPHVPDDLLGTILFKRPPALVGKILTLIPDHERASMALAIKSRTFDPGQISAAEIRFIQLVRSLERQRIATLEPRLQSHHQPLSVRTPIRKAA